MIIFSQKIWEARNIFQIIIFSFNQLWINLVIPYAMLLKIIKTKKSQPIIPQELQRHGEDEEAEEADGNDIYVENKNEIKDKEQNELQSTSKKPQLHIPQNIQRYQNLPKPNGEIVLDPKTLTKQFTKIKEEKNLPKDILELT